MNQPTTLHLLDALNQPATLVEASAGTGKTFSIAFLYMRLVAENGFEIDEILVTTFTDAATKELRERIRGRLLEAKNALSNREQKPADPLVAQWIEQLDAHAELTSDLALRRLRLALVNFDEAPISTLHGFCKRVLSEHAFDSGTAFDQELVKDESSFVSTVLADAWIGALHNAKPDLLHELESVFTYSKARKFFIESLRASPEHVVDQYLHGNIDSRKMNANAFAHRFKRALAIDGRRAMDELKQEAGVMSYRDLLVRVLDGMPHPDSPLARKVGARFKAVLVDEFQDTDPIQCRIIQHAFDGRAQLYFIGDPKQAIYRFRGADIFAYLDAARRFSGVRRTLDKNWRSDPALVGAINHLFMRDELASPFLYEGIRFHPIESGVRGESSALSSDLAPLTFLWLESSAFGLGQTTKRLGIDAVKRKVAGLTADRIVKLLKGESQLEGRNVLPPDLAVLVRTNEQAVWVQDALRARGIPSVLNNPESVWSSPEASELHLVLQAIAQPHNTRAMRRALITPLFGLRSQDLVELEKSDTGWDDYAQAFRAWNAVWLKRGFVHMVGYLLAQQEVPKKLLAYSGGERKLTNLLHLIELLHGAAASDDLQVDGILGFLEARRAEGDDGRADESSELRLESDEDAVQIMTVHRSKGLEFPIVFCPYLWNGVPIPDKKTTHVLYHDPKRDWALTLDLGSENFEDAKRLFTEENFAEELRLTYVALTRAKHACFVSLGYINKAERSPLSYLLHANEERLSEGGLVHFMKRVAKDMTELQIRAEIEKLVDSSGSGMGFERITRPPGRAMYSRQYEPKEIVMGRYDRPSTHRWGVTSFSQLRSGQQQPGPGEDGLDHDQNSAKVRGITEGLGRIPLVDFPKGSKSGTFFHTLLEHLDFQRVWQPETMTLVQGTMDRFGIDRHHAGTVRKALAATVETSLAEGLRLFVIGSKQRLDEMEFHLPIAGNPAPLSAEKLAAVFRRHQSASVVKTYPDQLVHLTFREIEGYLKGFIDLIFEHQGRYYVVDYKSNHLGDEYEAYQTDRLGPAMAHGDYYLQYHLYLLALHRMLGLRKKDYDYDRHIGGVFYLFIKGMEPRRGPSHGVFFDRPSRAMIDALSELF